ncbi:unnamed protein product, partial [Owenia fusiformis]
MLYGKIVVIKRNGSDGAHFPLTSKTCLFGRSNDCDIRIQLPNVSKEHCRIDVNENGEIFLTNMSSVNPTMLNKGDVKDMVQVQHSDVFTIIDRSFRFEFPPSSPFRTPKKTPVKGSPKKSKSPGTGKVLTPKNKPPTPASTPKASTSDTQTSSKVLTPKVKPPVSTTPNAKTPSSEKAKSSPKATTPKAATPKPPTPKATTPRAKSPKAVTPKPATPKA